MEVFILKIFDLNFVSNEYLKNKISSLSHIFLSYIYYKKFGKVLNLDNILKDKSGKPYLKNNEFLFNISHSKNYICIGVSNSQIGVDIEENRIINKNAIKKFLTENEINNPKIPPLKYWVIKEAYSKYLGLGLRMNFKSIDLNLINTDLFVEEVKSENFICYAISKASLKNVFLVDNYLILEYIKNICLKFDTHLF